MDVGEFPWICLPGALILVSLILYGVDAPERRQPFGDKARRFLVLRAGGSEVEVDPIGTDRYARTVALVYPRGAQISLNELLVREGLAWVYPRYCRLPACSRWRQLQRRARQARLGLWSLPVPIAPWRFRRDRRAAVLRPPPARQRPWGGLVYHGNPKTRVFHAPGCRFYNCKGCVVIFRSRQEALRAGYRPCRICNP